MFNIPIEIFSNYRLNFNDKALAGMSLIFTHFIMCFLLTKYISIELYSIR